MRAPLVVQWLATLTSKPTRVSSSLIGCPIHSALCHIEAKNFVNYNSISSMSTLTCTDPGLNKDNR